MEYPEALYSNGRPRLSNNEILKEHYLYQRHKPGYDWKEEEGLPDFTKIKIDPNNPERNQSYNWEKFSEPHWVRFNPQKEYQIEYAVVGYLTETIRNLNQYDSGLPNKILDVEHAPVDINYSHCQLSCIKTPETRIDKTKKRAMRQALKNKSKVFLAPNQKAHK